MSDERNDNVIPFSIRDVVFTALQEPGDTLKLSLAELVQRIEAYGFECEAGPIANCAEWRELMRRLKP
jgi:hypothetical protein